jgi:pyruvate dehydrogenase E2 component (dihydrolipoamide acetyltransferase)
MIELKLPELGENIETAEVIRLLVSEGDVIKADQNVMELESEKAAFPLPSTHAGKVTKIRVKEGEAVSVGQALLDIEESHEGEARHSMDKPAAPEREKGAGAEVGDGKRESREDKEKPAIERGTAIAKPVRIEPANKRALSKEPPAEQEAAGDRQRQELEKSTPAAGPATRRLARELGVNLDDVHGSEAGGRITRDDVKAYVRQRILAAEGGSEVPSLPDFSRWGKVTRQRLNRIGRTAAERLSFAWRTIPHVTQHELADITDLEAARVRFNESLRDGKTKVTVTVLAIQAAVIALRAFPQFNSSFDASTGELIIKEFYHIGVAVDTEQGLLVPVLRDANQKSTVELATELAELAEKARSRSLTPEQMQGGTFTITNLGGIGGTAFTPIINYPEVAILGISRARWERTLREGKMRRRLLVPLSLSYDHRVINGADGVRFIRKVAELLAEPFRLLVES